MPHSNKAVAEQVEESATLFMRLVESSQRDTVMISEDNHLFEKIKEKALREKKLTDNIKKKFLERLSVV